MKWLVPLMLLLVALIHLPPVLGVLGVAGMEAAYGVGIAGPDLAVLMRHRALMFGLLGGFMLLAMFVRALQPWALLLALLSAGGFVLLAWTTPGHNANLARVALVDVAAVGFALVGLAAWWWQRRNAAATLAVLGWRQRTRSGAHGHSHHRQAKRREPG